MIEKPLKTVGDLVQFLTDNCTSRYKLSLLAYGCGKEIVSPVVPSLFEIDKDTKTVTIMADWN